MAITNVRTVQRVEVYPPQDASAAATTNAAHETLMVVYMHTFDDSDDADLPVSMSKTAHLSNFLHPILELYNNGKIVKTKHIAEHFTTTFKLENEHKKPLKDFLENINLK